MNNRLTQVKTFLQQEHLDAALISSVPNIIYLTNFTYFSYEEREAYLLITKKNSYLFTDARYSHAVKTYLQNLTLSEISSTHSFEKLLKQILTKEGIKKLGIEENNLVVHEHKKIADLATTRHFSLSSLRQIKTPEEIQFIQQACRIGDKAFSFILKKIKIGMTEKKVAHLLEMFIRKNGAEPSFATIVAFQENAAIPHHKTGKRTLKQNEAILLDFGVKYENYCSDMTRIIFFGKATVRQKRIYQTVLAAQQKAIDCLKENLKKEKKVTAADVDNTARNYIIQKGYPSIPHSLGHGIGLQVHEAPHLSPKAKNLLINGMVFSIEPGIYLPDHVGVRIEDLFAIQDGKLIQLTRSPRELLEI